MKLEHLAIYCLDLERMKDFFVKFFDCTAGEKYHNEELDFKSYFLSLPDGATRIELMTRPEITTEVREALRAGLIHIAISLGSKEAVDEKTASIVASGYECISSPRTTGDGYYESCIVGPEGLFIELTK